MVEENDMTAGGDSIARTEPLPELANGGRFFARFTGEIPNDVFNESLRDHWDRVTSEFRSWAENYAKKRSSSPDPEELFRLLLRDSGYGNKGSAYGLFTGTICSFSRSRSPSPTASRVSRTSSAPRP